MSKARAVLMVLSLALGMGFAGCQRVSLSPPEGFAKMGGQRQVRAISPEGVRLEVRLTENTPAQRIDFWKEALKTQLQKEGYRQRTDEKMFETSSGKGTAIEWLAPYRDRTYVYLTGVVVAGTRLAVIEAGGELKLFRKYRQDIYRSLRTISISP